MKGLLSTKTISSISDKKSAARIARHLPSLNSNELTLEKVSCIAFPVYNMRFSSSIYPSIWKQTSKNINK